MNSLSYPSQEGGDSRNFATDGNKYIAPKGILKATKFGIEPIEQLIVLLYLG